MPATTTNPTHRHHSVLSRVRGWRPLAKASAAAGAAATDGDIFVLQDESNTTSLSQYDSRYASSAAQAQAANSAVKVYSELSTANGTAQADQFFLNMKAAGD